MSLELSRIVNDALQNNDYKAAFAPLYAQPDLRPSELPTIEKKSLTLLSRALGEEHHARFWVAALFAPQNAVHLFAYKTLLRLGSSLTVLAAPLHAALEKRWQSYERKAAEKNPPPSLPQDHIARIVEVFFCADPQLALEVTQQQAKFYGPIQDRHSELWRVYRARQQAAEELLKQALNEISRAELGRDWGVGIYVLYASPDQDIVERAKSRPDVATAFQAVGPEPPLSPYIGYPSNDCHAGLARISHAKSEPQKLVRDFLKKPLQENYKAALQSDQACSELLYGLVHHSLVDDTLYGQLVTILTNVIQEPQAAQEIRERAKTGLWPLTPRLSLWAWTLNRLAQIYTESPTLEKAQQLYTLLQPLETPEYYGGFCSNLRAQHGEVLLTLPPEKPLTSPQSADPTRFNPHSFTVTMPTAEYPGAQGLFPPATRQAGEDALAFLARVYAEYAANAKKLEEVSQQYHKTFRQTTQATHYGHHPQASVLRSQQYKAFEESLKLFTPAEKHEIMVYLARGGEVGGEVGLKTTPVLSLWAKSEEERLKFLAPVASQLWEGCAQAIEDIKREEKRRDTRGDNIQAMSRAYEKLDYLQWEIIRLEGLRGRSAVIQMASKHRATSLVQRLEWGLLNDAREWRTGEDRDEFLAYFAKRLPRWSPSWRRQGYGLLAGVLYQSQTPEFRRQSWEFTALAGGVSSGFFEAVRECDDTETWAELLCTLPQKDARFFELWSRWRQRPAPRERAFYALLNVLPRVTTEQVVFMVLPMLAEFTLEERPTHVETWAQTLEHPHPKIAKWAFETLLAVSHPTLEWERATEAAGEKLWSEILGLTKVAARFLGTAPSDHAALAWDKLSDALELENTALVEAVLKAMVALYSKDKTLRLSAANQERLEQLAQLAPERFGPLQRRLGAAAGTPSD